MPKRFFSICAFVFFLIFTSCLNKNKNSGSISLDVSNFFTLLTNGKNENIENDLNNYSLSLTVFGDYSYDYSFSGKLKDFKEKKISIDNIPLGSEISILLNISKNNELYYTGTSSINKIESGNNSLNMKMRRADGCSKRMISSDASFLSSPIITVKASGGETIKGGKLIFNSESEVVFSVSGEKPYPDNTLYIWFINGEQVFSEYGEAYSSSTLAIDFSQNPDFEIQNKITVWVYSDEIMKSANVDFLFTDSI